MARRAIDGGDRIHQNVPMIATTLSGRLGGTVRQGVVLRLRSRNLWMTRAWWQLEDRTAAADGLSAINPATKANRRPTCRTTISVLCSAISSSAPRFGSSTDVSLQFFVASRTQDPAFQSRDPEFHSQITVSPIARCITNVKIHISVRGSTVSTVFTADRGVPILYWGKMPVLARSRILCRCDSVPLEPPLNTAVRV